MITAMIMLIGNVDPKTEEFVDFWSNQMKAFVSRHQDGKRGATRFDVVTLRVALAVHARSKSAYDVLSRILQLPKDRTMRK